MTKVYCDRCGRESGFGYFTIQVPCHIAGGGRGYIDREGNEVSGRMVNFDLCAKCANEVNAITDAMTDAEIAVAEYDQHQAETREPLTQAQKHLLAAFFCWLKTREYRERMEEATR